MKKTVRPIPQGYSSVTPYLICRGAAKAMDFYKKAFGAKEVARMNCDETGKLMHGELRIGDSMVMLADEFPEMGCQSPQALKGTPVTLHLYVESVDKTVAQAVKAGAKIERPVEDQFYGDRSGTLQDPFGHKWHVSTHVEDLTPEQIRLRAKEKFAQPVSA